MSSVQILRRISELPGEMYRAGLKKNIWRRKLDSAKLTYSRELAKAYLTEKARKVPEPVARELAKEAVDHLHGNIIFCKSKYEARSVYLRKLQDEFVSLRKIAQMDHDERFSISVAGV